MSHTTMVHLVWYCKYAPSYGEKVKTKTTDCKPNNKHMNEISWLQVQRIPTYIASKLCYQLPFLSAITLDSEQ